MICELVFSLLLSSGTTITTQTPDSAKPAQSATDQTPSPKAKRIRVGGNVAKSQLKHKVQPEYPLEARDQKIQGTVRLHVILSTAGKVQQLNVISGDPILAKAAADAVRLWEYKPFLLNGEPVEVDTTVDVVFSLRD